MALNNALRTYFQFVSSCKGVGVQTEKALAKLLLPADLQAVQRVRFRELLFHLPMHAIDRSKLHTIREAKAGNVVTLKVRIGEHMPPAARHAKLARRPPYRIVAEDNTGSILITLFHAKSDYLHKQYPTGETRIISGKLEWYDGMLVMPHPDWVMPESRAEEVLRVQPIYPGSAALGSKMIARIIAQALTQVVSLPEWISESVLRYMQWHDFLTSLRSIHQPSTVESIGLFSPPRLRLAYDELLAHQWMMCTGHQQEKAMQSAHIPYNNCIHQALCKHLPYQLTASQQQVLQEIYADMASGRRMVRLLQGDVGSGKTIVAFAAMVQAAAAGLQAVLMVPTDLLARQHAESLMPMAQELGFKSVLVTGKLTASERKKALDDMASGEATIIIGTHALFQTKVALHQLGLMIIDEQHRFGVGERLRLSQKGIYPHVLQMTATPIPRSLTQTIYGDMDVSIMNERPPGRLPIDTRVLSIEKLDAIIHRLQEALVQQKRIYWVCPLIAPSLNEDGVNITKEYADVESRFASLKQRFGKIVGMVHGKMSLEERNGVMQQFAKGDIQILVATTVIEVGVNVPEATIMIIESAERFGLAQLHQLRGRVGRSSEASSCVLLYENPLSETARTRLEILRNTNDGFVIAEEDMRLRGMGDMLGYKQTGMPEFHFADIFAHGDLVRMAREEIQILQQQDPRLQSTQGKAFQSCLALFGYNEHVLELRNT